MQKIINGIKNLPLIINKIGIKKPLFVYGRSYQSLCIKDSIESLPVKSKLSFSDFTSNPIFEQVCKGFTLFNEADCDSIIALGGGSAIDVAKCIKLASLAKEGLASLIPPLVSYQIPIDNKRIPLIAIPTTAGSGSESTHNAVIYYEGTKQTVTNEGILPEYAILEPSVLKTLPLYQKKCTMMDALCQGIESWWSINSTDKSKEYSLKTIELIIANWRQYIFDNDEKAADKIMLAANYGGRAINISQTTAAHAMSYKITAMYNLPHGHAVALCLPEVWSYMLDSMDKCHDPRGQAYLQKVFQNISESMMCTRPNDAIQSFRDILLELDLRFDKTSNEDDIHKLADSINPIRLKNNPIPIDRYTAINLYRSITVRDNNLPNSTITEKP